MKIFIGGVLYKNRPKIILGKIILVAIGVYVRMYCLISGELINILSGHKKVVSDMCPHPKRNNLVYTSGGSEIFLWDLAQKPKPLIISKWEIKNKLILKN
jgi:WD40 repeat protein